jgi:hypothetical protein
VQRSKGLNLKVDVRSGVDEGPSLAAGTHGESGVGPSPHPRLMRPHPPAQVTRTIPLGVTTSRGCPQKAQIQGYPSSGIGITALREPA